MPATKTPRTGKIQQVDYTASARATREMPKNVYGILDCMLNINHTYVSTVPTILGLLKMITSLQLTVNGRDTKLNVPFFHLYHQALIERRFTPLQSLYTTTSGSGNSYVYLPVPFVLQSGVLPQDALLDGRFFDSMVLEVNWAGLLMGTETVNSGYLQFEPRFYSDVPASMPAASHELSYANRNLDAVGDIRIDIPVKNLNQYSRIWIYTFNNSSVLANAQISNVKLETASFIYHDTNATFLQARNMADYGVSQQTGIYVLDLTTFGYMIERLNAMALSELTLVLTSLVSNGSVYVVFEKAIYRPSNG